jgi:hypothetical protein
MRSWRGSVRFVLATLVGLSCVDSASAQLQVATAPGEPLAIAHAELAYAVGAGTPVTWLSLRVKRGPVAIVAALPPDASADAGLDAWFSALELTASPNVTLPRSATNCGQTGSFVHVAWPRSAGAMPTELSVQAPEDAAAALQAQGLAVAGELPRAERYLIWSWPATDNEQTTRTLRIVGGVAPLALRPGVSFPLLISSVTRGGVALPTELFNRELSVTFVADRRPGSDYVERVRDWLGSRPEPLLETRARGPLFDWSIYDDTVSLGSLVASYATRAGKEVPDLDVDGCGDQLRALRDPEAPSAAACGDATDVSLALAAAGSELATLQRFVVAGVNGFAPEDAVAGGVPSSPVLRAQLLDDSACPIIDQPLPPRPPGGTSNDGPRAPGGTTTVVIEETVVVDDSRTEVSCGGSPQPEPEDSYYGSSSSDGCSSDTSSSSETESSDACSGDSSSSSDDNGCASDSSSSSSSNDSGCASDSSSSSSSDDSGCASDSSSSSDDASDSCSGSSESSSYDGDTCTGAAAPGAERTQKASAGLSSRPGVHRPRRLKTSLWSMAFVALVLPIRRRKRGHVRRG